MPSKLVQKSGTWPRVATWQGRKVWRKSEDAHLENPKCKTSMFLKGIEEGRERRLVPKRHCCSLKGCRSGSRHPHGSS